VCDQIFVPLLSHTHTHTHHHHQHYRNTRSLSHFEYKSYVDPIFVLQMNVIDPSAECNGYSQTTADAEVIALWKAVLPTKLQDRISEVILTKTAIHTSGSDTDANNDDDVHISSSCGRDARVFFLRAPLVTAPQSFGSDYVLPVHYDKPLQELHSHPLDADLVFYEKPHIYTYKGVPTTASVTALAHAFEKPFVASEAIDGMKKGRTQVWPRVEYVHGASPLMRTRDSRTSVLGEANAHAVASLVGTEQVGQGAASEESEVEVVVHTSRAWDPSLGAMMVDSGKTIAVVHPHSMTDESDVIAMLHMLRASTMKGSTADPFDVYAGRDTDAEVYVFDREMSAREIEESWKHKGMIASHRGTEAHFQAELFFNGLPFRSWEPEMKILLEFVAQYLVPAGLVAHQTEKEIVCVDADVAGSIDLIVYDAARDVYHIIDHKRSDKLKRDLRGYSKMKAPFTHLDDCKGAAYALQTSIYQFILEREYGMRIGERVLLSLHPDQPFVTSVPYLKAEAEFIMTSRFELVRARRAVGAMGFQCSLTNAPLVDAVRLVDGDALAMEKAAIVRELEYVPDGNTRAQFDRLVAERTRPVAFTATASWRRLMPESGLVPSFLQK